MRPLMLCVLAVGLVGSCGGLILSLASPDTSPGNISITPASYELGEVTEGVYSTGTTLRNSTSHAVRITSVNASCSCSAVSHSETWVAPNESIKVECEWDLRGKDGGTNAMVQLELETRGSSGPKELNPLTLLLNADVQPHWWTTPQVIQFDANERHTIRLTLECIKSGPPVRIISCEPSHHAITAFVRHDRTSVDVQFNPNEWRQRGPVHIALVTDSDLNPVRTVGVWIRQIPAITESRRPMEGRIISLPRVEDPSI